MSRTPKEIIADLAPAYKGWKGNEKDKEKFRKEFLAAVTEELEAGDLAETVVAINEADEAKARALAEKQFPAYCVIDSRPNPDYKDSWEFIIQEDPAYKDYTIEFDGQVWGRQVVSGSTFIDDEKLREDDSELWRKVSEYPHRQLVEDVAYESGKDPSECEFEKDGFPSGWDGFIEWQLKRHGYNREILPLENLDPETLAKLQPYIYEGKPSVKLPAPKKAEDD